MSDKWEDVHLLSDYGESSGTGPWFKIFVTPHDLDFWRGRKGQVFEVVCAKVNDSGSHLELDKNYVWRNDAQMLGFGESDSSGGWAKFRVEPEDLAFFRGQKGESFYWKFRMVETGEVAPVKGRHGKAIKLLHQAGFFRAPGVWKALGTDKDYQAWTRQRKCVITGGYDWDERTGEGRTEYCHVRRAGESGTGYKPAYMGVPMVHDMHKLQHDKGELAAFQVHQRMKGQDCESAEEAKAWFVRKAIDNAEAWAHERLASALAVKSLTQADPKQIAKWAEDNALAQYLPASFKKLITP